MKTCLRWLPRRCVPPAFRSQPSSVRVGGTWITSISPLEIALYCHERRDPASLAPFAKLGQIDPSVTGFAVIDPRLRARKSFTHLPLR